MSATVTNVSPENSQALLTWLEAIDQRVEWLFTTALLIAAFYAYYLVVAPFVINDRLHRLQDASDDLTRLTKQFSELRDRYDTLLNLGLTSGRDLVDAVRFFESRVLPPVRSSIQKLPEAERLLATTDLAAIDRSLGVLRQLERRHRQSHPPTDGRAVTEDPRGREAVALFRRALGELLGVRGDVGTSPDSDQRAVAALEQTTMGRPTGTHILDEPVNSLSNLQELDEVISALTNFNNRQNNWTFADEARKAGVSTGDTLMLSFAPFASLQEYSFPTNRFAFEATSDLRVYESVAAFIGAPFSVTTLEDLQRLAALVDSQRSELSTQLTTPTVTVPVVEATIDRFIIVGLGPLSFLAVVGFMHACQIKRQKLTKLLEGDSSAQWFIEHSKELAPHSFASRLIAKGALLWMTVGFVLMYVVHSILVSRIDGAPAPLQVLGWILIAAVFLGIWYFADRSKRIAASL